MHLWLGLIVSNAGSQMQNAARFHICSSETEGYGHYLVEAAFSRRGMGRVVTVPRPGDPPNSVALSAGVEGAVAPGAGPPGMSTSKASASRRPVLRDRTRSAPDAIDQHGHRPEVEPDRRVNARQLGVGEAFLA